MPVAGKTGTPQNWSDAWAVGYSPYYTTAVWFGFDKPGNSLGVDLTGSTLAGPVWGDYMREIHQGLARRDFVRPAAGVIEVTVCAKSGLLKTPSCNEGEVTLPFLTGTQPTQACTVHGGSSWSSVTALNTMRSDTLGMDDNVLLGSLTMPSLPTDLFPDLPPARGQNNRNNSASRNSVNRNSAATNRRNSQPNRNSNSNPPVQNPLLWYFNNPLLDGDLDTDTLPVGNSPEPQYDTSSDDVMTHNVPDEDSGYGLEMPSYNPLLD
jgi:penicillin-binding protein 1A